MLELKVDTTEFYDENTNEFIYIKPVVLRLEHSLVSISKWESKWKVPFLSFRKPEDEDQAAEQMLDYIKCMTINQNVDPLVYRALTTEHIKAIENYISEEKTATTFNNQRQAPNRQVVTSELIYFWMSAYNIPMECQKWHLSRLLTLIRIASIENQPKEKMTKKAIFDQNRSLNAARRKALHTKG